MPGTTQRESVPGCAAKRSACSLMRVAVPMRPSRMQALLRNLACLPVEKNSSHLRQG